MNTKFKPATHGFRFANTFQNDVVKELDIRSSGLCGGMVYAALDYFYADQPIPAQDYRPAVQTPLHDFIYNRQVHSVADNWDKWLELALSHNRTTEFFRWGLQGFGGGRLEELRTSMPPPVPLGLLEYGGGGPGSHQVLAIGYDVGRYDGKFGDYQSDLKIYVYDPNYPLEQRTLRPDLKAESYYYEQKPSQRWRTYFVNKKYKMHALPVLPKAVDTPSEGWVRELLLEILTGEDDLRGGNDNVNATIDLGQAGLHKVANINQSRRWIDNYAQNVSIRLPCAVPLDTIASVTLQTTFAGGSGSDDWNVNRLRIIAMTAKREVLYDQRGTPLHRFSYANPGFVAKTKLP